MDTEVTGRENHTSQDLEKALKELRDNAVMLTLANEYLCEDFFLKKIGASIKENIKVVESHITILKRQFVGKPTSEIDLREPVERVAEFAEHLEGGEDNIKRKCRQGDLGRELDEKVTLLSGEIDALKDRIDGTSVSYTKTDSVMGFLARFKFIVRSLVATSRFTLRITALFVIVCLILFFYLFITMETERAPMRAVEESRARILSAQEDLVRINEALSPLQKKAEAFKKDDLTREEEIKLLELNLKAYKLDEKRQKALIEVKMAEKELQKKLKELEVVRQKSFLERLFKQ
jgi:hypothetical protein